MLDFSKAFDTVRHASVLRKLSSLPIEDNIYNWFVNYFRDHSHKTKFGGNISGEAKINSSVFQGSAVGPPLFVINGIDLKPCFPNNFMDKYADDTFLIIPASNEHTIAQELQAIEQWALNNTSSLTKVNRKNLYFLGAAVHRPHPYPLLLLTSLVSNLSKY